MGMDKTEQYWLEAQAKVKDYLNGRITARGNQVWPAEHNYRLEEISNLLKENGVVNIMDVGCGYGRDSIYFAKQGFNITGIDISSSGISLARAKAEQEKLNISFIEADFMRWGNTHERFDCVYLYKVLHQIRPKELSAIISKISDVLSYKGIVVVATFSTDDPGYGRGKMIEPDVYDERHFRPVHYFSWCALEDLLASFNILWRELVTTPEQTYEKNPDKVYQHKMWYVVAKRQ
jgi:2-polyprenyl-3-methyl-5-hydroxy-6-metoxy-1,4-benzoquinol methylase